MGRQVIIQGLDEEKLKQPYKGHHKTDYRKEAIKAAQELCYDYRIIIMIQNAETEEEITRILHDARTGKL